MKRNNFKKIVLTGGGTAGHILPTLAVAEEIEKQAPKTKFIYIGSKYGLESKIIPGTKYQFYGISVGKLKRYWAWDNFLTLFKVFIGFFESLKILYYERPDVIFAKGGYVTVPVVIAGWFLKIPSIIHESDSILGLANKILSVFSYRIATAYPSRYYHKKYQKKIVYAGLPIRKDFLEINKNKLYEKFDLSSKLPIVLVFGGSQGAHQINILISKIIRKILKNAQVIHITGDMDNEKMNQKRSRLTEDLKERYKIFRFITDEMPDALNVADLVISRCGANTLAEISACKKPAILIPLSTSASNHQISNALIFQENKAAVILNEKKIKPIELLKKINDLISRPFLLEELGKRANKFYRPNSAQIIAKEIINL